MARRKPRPPVAGLDDVALKFGQKLLMESDRGCVLVGMAAIDELLEKALRSYFQRSCGHRRDSTQNEIIDFLLVKEPVPPLGTFGIRIRMCCALGIFSTQLYRQLYALGLLRNTFAHVSEPVELTDADIRSFTTPEKWTKATKKFVRDTQEEANAAHVSGKTEFSAARIQFMGLISQVLLCVSMSDLAASDTDNTFDDLKNHLVFQPPAP